MKTRVFTHVHDSRPHSAPFCSDKGCGYSTYNRKCLGKEIPLGEWLKIQAPGFSRNLSLPSEALDFRAQGLGSRFYGSRPIVGIKEPYLLVISAV